MATSFQIHGFSTAKLQMTLWKGVHATTPSVEVVLIERLRLLCQSARDSGTLINASTMTASRVEVDQIHGPLEVYSRSRAWFMTMAYASIRKPAWFDLQTAVFASEKIFDLVQRTSGGRFPPLSFLIEAWANTVNHFAEQVRVTGKPLSELVVNTGTWEHKWTWTAPQAVNGGAAVDLPRYLANDVADAATQARQAQSQMDRQANARRHIAEGIAGGDGGLCLVAKVVVEKARTRRVRTTSRASRMIVVSETLTEDQTVAGKISESGRVNVAGTGADEQALQQLLINGQLTKRCAQSY